MKSRRQTNIEATRAALMEVARRHFARDGYSKSEIGRIAAEAGVTTGAIYHHFGSKKGLFLAVAEALEASLLAAADAIDERDLWGGLRRSFERLIEVCAAPEVQRILFVEAPQVIGSEDWREIELRYALGAVRGVLGVLMERKVLKPYPIDLVARTLLALLRETSAELARSGGDPRVRAQIVDLVGGVLDSLETRPAA